MTRIFTLPRLAVPALLMLLHVGCGPGTLSPTAYLSWVQDPSHGLRQDRTFTGVVLRLQYRPVEQVVLTRNSGTVSLGEMQAQKEEQRGCYQFHLQLRTLGGGDALDAAAHSDEDYYSRLYYFTGDVENDLALVVNGDTLPCALAHFERTYGASPFNSLAISFVDEHRAEPASDLELLYDDHAYGLGPVSFIIKREDLLRIPAIKLS